MRRTDSGCRARDWDFGIRASGFGSFIALSLLLTFIVSLLGDTPLVASEEPNLKITVWLYNYAQVSPRTLASAEQEAARVFHAAGMETVWVEMPVSAGEQRPQLSSPKDMPSGELVLILTARAKAGKLGGHLGPLGFAMPCAVDDPTCRAYVFSDRVEDIACVQNAPLARALAHVITHELGHLLLGPHAHSPTGIMQGIWPSEALVSAGQGVLLFTPQQAQVIRAAVGRRNTPTEAAAIRHAAR